MPNPDPDPVAAAARNRVNTAYAKQHKWVPNAEQIRVFFDTREALQNYVGDIACEIAAARLSGSEMCMGTRPWLETLKVDEAVVHYYADNSDRLDFCPTTIHLPIADVLPEFAAYQAVGNALGAHPHG